MLLSGASALRELDVQEAAMRARAKQADLETKKANEILLSFKKLDAQREIEADAAIEGATLCCAVLCCAVLCCAVLCCAVLAVLCCAEL